MLYQNKELHEIETAISNFIKNYESRTGQKPDKKKIKAMFEEIAAEKEKAMFLNCFETYTPKSLRDAAEILEKTK